MTRDPEPYETSAAGPFLTLRADGPLQGVVTVTAITEGHGRALVAASWVQDGHSHSDSVQVDSFEQARELAHFVADELRAGTPPDLSRD